MALDTGAAPIAAQICFTINTADGAAQRLWHRCLDGSRAEDRAAQTVSLAVPPGTSQISLEAQCQSGCDESPDAYWGRP